MEAGMLFLSSANTLSRVDSNLMLKAARTRSVLMVDPGPNHVSTTTLAPVMLAIELATWISRA